MTDFERDCVGNRLKATRTAHIFEVGNRLFLDEWNEIHEGNFVTFDEAGLFNTIHETLEEAEAALRAYCLSLDGRNRPN